MQTRVTLEVKDTPQPSAEGYSILRDSVVAKYAANTATMSAVLDAVINLLTSRIKSVDQFFAEQIPYYLKGLYYLLPLGVPSIPFFRHRWRNQPEVYDPDALELLKVLQENDEHFDTFINENAHEREHILTLLTHYLKHEKNQPYNIVINLIFLSIRTAQGFLVFSKGFDVISEETHKELSEWTSLISAISSMSYMIIMLLHNNFEKYSFTEKKHDYLRTLLNHTLFKVKEKLKPAQASEATDLRAPLLQSSSR